MAVENTIIPPTPVLRGKVRRNRFVGLLVHTLVWTYAFALLTAWLLIHRGGERWWLATLLLFGPRWMFATPLALLVPLTALWRRRLLWVVAGCAVFTIFVIWNLAVPWHALVPSSGTNSHVRVLTCNTHRQFLNVPQLLHLIATENPDVVVLQEWTFGPYEAQAMFPAPAWHLRIDRELITASKFPISRAQDVLPPGSGLEGIAFCYDLQSPDAIIRLVNLHLASPHLVFSDALHRTPDAPDEIADNCLERRIESQRITTFLGNTNTPTLLAGDFNTPIDSETFRNAWTNFSDAFAVAGWGFGVTYRVKWTRTRIDHILFDSQWQCKTCWLGPDVGSPHLPVIADLELRR